MVNTGWVTSYAQTALPLNSTMWFIDVLLLCYLLYFLVRKLAKNQHAYMGACMAMVLVGWVCLEHSPRLPFLWGIDGRGYAPFFLGTLVCEFQVNAKESMRKAVSVAWATLILAALVVRFFVGFENMFGPVGGYAYVRYFEFIVAPGLLLAALNLHPISSLLARKPIVWAGLLSGALYYVHNNVMEDYLILNAALGSRLDFSSGLVFLAVVASVIPFAVLWQHLSKRGQSLLDSARASARRTFPSAK